MPSAHHKKHVKYLKKLRKAAAEKSRIENKKKVKKRGK